MSMYGVAYAPLEPGKGDGAKQSMKKECDVNRIVARYVETGMLEHLATGIPAYVDVSELGDYRSIIEQVRSVESYFAKLPAAVRGAFEHDPAVFMDYLETASAEDLEKFGLDALGDRPRARIEVEEPMAPVVAPEVPDVAPEEPGTVST